jgi:hypothetical protein
MSGPRIDGPHNLTPKAYRCPACKAILRMQIEWPFWRCPQCGMRLIPADLYPIEPSSTSSPVPDPAINAPPPSGPSSQTDEPQ